MAKVHIAFYLGKKSVNSETTIFDQMVCFFTRSEYSHLEYVNYYNCDTGKGVCWSSSPLDKGVRQAIISLDSGSWELYEVETDTTKEEIVDWFEKHKGSKYDWIGAFATKLPLIRESIKRWFCSEAIGAAFKIPKPSTFTPQNVFDHFKVSAVRIHLCTINTRLASIV